MIIIVIITYIYHVLINTLSAHVIHTNLNTIFYTHVEHSPTKTIYIKYYMETHTHTCTQTRTHTHARTRTHKQTCIDQITVGPFVDQLSQNLSVKRGSRRWVVIALSLIHI